MLPMIVWSDLELLNCPIITLTGHGGVWFELTNPYYLGLVNRSRKACPGFPKACDEPLAACEHIGIVKANEEESLILWTRRILFAEAYWKRTLSRIRTKKKV